ncbi:MAG TPA: LysR substrate-binding domain-containing protein [Candidatus Limnocylindrales bacterium]
MELRQLEYFVAVADEASFTRAAEKLHVSQPGVSAQIRQLERELGQELLDRSGRTVRVTDVGAAVLGYAREALGAASGAQLAVDAFTGLIRGRVAVGMVIACSSFDFAELLAGYHRSYPAVEIALSEANSDELIARLQSGQLDLAYIALGGVAPAGLDLLEIADEALVAAVSEGDALATCRSMPLAAIGDRTLLSLPRGTGIRAIFDEACAGIGLRPRITLEASNLGILARLASLGLGVAILPESVAAATPGLHAIEITDPRMRGKVALAWRTEGPTGPAAQALIRGAREAIARV